MSKRWSTSQAHRKVIYRRTSEGYVPWQVTKYETCTSINLKIRRASKPGSLCTMEVIMQTLLHELAYIVIQDEHGLQFYWCNVKLLKSRSSSFKLGLVKAAARQIPKRVVLPGNVKALKRLFLTLVS
jgi:hypothetical protein